MANLRMTKGYKLWTVYYAIVKFITKLVGKPYITAVQKKRIHYKKIIR